MPGAHDYNIDADGVLQPGLGRDEPSDAQRATAKAAGLATMNAFKEELAVASAELTEKQQALSVQQRALQAKEEDLERRERALAAAASPPADE